jgi:multiple sugar transport system ATP-binding protein
MGRAIVRKPVAYLMDEPLSNLDAKLRVTMRTSLAQLHATLNTTTIYVTHDQIEAMTLGTRVAVMRDGKLQQVDVPQTLYEQPANTFVAAFIGSPSMNLVEAQLDGDQITFGPVTLPLDATRRPASLTKGPVVLGIRPEAFEDTRFAKSGLPEIDVTVEVIEELGSDAFVYFALDAEGVVVEDALSDDSSDETMLLAAERDRVLFVARVDPRTNAKVGERIRLAIEPSRLYFFAPETGESLLRAPTPDANGA